MEKKLVILKSRLNEFKSAVIAFSGGVDSQRQNSKSENLASLSSG